MPVTCLFKYGGLKSINGYVDGCVFNGAGAENTTLSIKSVLKFIHSFMGAPNMTNKRATKAAKRQAKFKKSNSKKNANKQARIGRFLATRKIVFAEWGELVHEANVPLSKLHSEDVQSALDALAAREAEGVKASIKKRSDGSFVLVDYPARFETADIAYEDGSVDPLDIIQDNGLPEHTEWLGYTVCNGDGMHMAKDQSSLVAKPEDGHLTFELEESDKLAGKFENGFSSMVFDTGNNILLAVVKPS